MSVFGWTVPGLPETILALADQFSAQTASHDARDQKEGCHFGRSVMYTRAVDRIVYQ